MNTEKIRGIQSVQANVNLDPQAVLGDLQAAFGEFSSKHAGKVDAMEKQLNAIETAVARGQFTGGYNSSNGGSVSAKMEYDKAFDAFARKGVDAGLRGLEVQAGMSTQSDPDGGFLVPDKLSKEIDRVASASVAMRRLANIVTVSEGDYHMPTSQGGAAAGWTGETDERTSTANPTLTMFSPAWCELYCMPEVTQKLLDLAAFDVGAWLSNEINAAETELEGTAFIRGNGVGQPKGLLSYDSVANSAWTWGKVGYIASGHATLLNNVDSLLALQHALKPVYRQNASWLMTDATFELCRKFKDGEGNYIWRPGLEPGAPSYLLGRPIEIDDNMDNIGAGKYPIAFGHFKRAYTIGGHTAGRRLIRDSLTKKGFVKFYMSKLIFGGLHNTEAVKFLKVAVS